MQAYPDPDEVQSWKSWLTVQVFPPLQNPFVITCGDGQEVVLAIHVLVVVSQLLPKGQFASTKHWTKSQVFNVEHFPFPVPFLV